ncbi:hypothetical protein HY620_02495 [Candidatus Uhrbacteria bacterium]|nr:hypothetical protein [Candidatus Uhrbacteria bacterium]
MKFKNRADAGHELALTLQQYAKQMAVVYAIPRGGVVVGGAIARALHIPLNIVVTKKIGHSTNPEYAIVIVYTYEKSDLYSGENHCLYAKKERTLEVCAYFGSLRWRCAGNTTTPSFVCSCRAYCCEKTSMDYYEAGFF